MSPHGFAHAQYLYNYLKQKDDIMKKLVIFFTVTWLHILVFATCVQAKDAIQTGASGYINWTEGVVYATGMGPLKGSTPESILMARRVAIADGQRNLLEMVQAVRVSSTTLVRDAMVENDEVRVTVQGLIRHPQIIDEQSGADGIFRVMMKMPMKGNLINALLSEDMLLSGVNSDASRLRQPLFSDTFLNRLWRPSAAHASDFTLDELNTLKKVFQFLQSDSPVEGTQKLERIIQDMESGGQYSGILIDARNVKGFRMAICPLIRTSDGKTVYPGQNVSVEHARLQRPVAYAMDIASATRNDRITSKPAVITAIDVYRQRVSDLVIDDSAAELIENMGRINASLFKQCKVMIVVSD